MRASATSGTRIRCRSGSLTVLSCAARDTARTRPSGSHTGASEVAQPCSAPALAERTKESRYCGSPVSRTRRILRSVSSLTGSGAISGSRSPRISASVSDSVRSMPAFARISLRPASKTARKQGDWVNAHSFSGSPQGVPGPLVTADTTSHRAVPPADVRRCASSPSSTRRPSRCRSATVPLHRSWPAGSRAASPPRPSASSSAAGTPTTSDDVYPSSRRASSPHSVTMPCSLMVAVAVYADSRGRSFPPAAHQESWEVAPSPLISPSLVPLPPSHGNPCTARRSTDKHDPAGLGAPTQCCQGGRSVGRPRGEGCRDAR